MKKSHREKKRIEEILADDKAVGKALAKGVKAALKQHKQAGNPIACWQDGKVVQLKPEEIPDLDEK